MTFLNNKLVQLKGKGDQPISAGDVEIGLKQIKKGTALGGDSWAPGDLKNLQIHFSFAKSLSHVGDAFHTMATVVKEKSP